ncbi:molybdate ABC transporter substrate-binding protein [Helicobacter suis]|uniref:molybdate ABC transporter substrate-binding protein n=1 Tax=Helicobacter suis TaxID=104628 RepID=UPI0013D16ED6|nr:molybdate ABC transporter substrate-binding protein [Helicobacter suis]
MRFLVLGILWVGLCLGAEIKVAVAANLTQAMQAIKSAFLKQHSAQVLLSFGSSGHFFNQIVQGAPFDLFISADKQRPLRLQQEKYTPYPVKVYARGVLVLWSKQEKIHSLEALQGSFNHLAIANPNLAPYGRASMEVLQKLGLVDALELKIVQAGSISQANQYVQSGAASLGFSALSLMRKDSHYFIVPKEYYSPIEQAMVLTKKGGENPLARALEDFILSKEGQTILKKYGYLVEELGE